MPPLKDDAPVPTSVAAPTPAPKSGFGRATALLSAATFLSRIMGLVREQVFAALLGAGFYGDAFTMAFRLPNLLRDLFAEGALSSAFQPVFVRCLKEEGQERAYQLANLVQSTLLLIVGGLTLLGILLAPQMVGAWAAGYAAIPGKAELTVLLARIMMPFLLLVSLAAVAMGMLNAKERFVAPALAPALFNLSAIVTGLFLYLFGFERSRGATIGWAIGTLVGGALQFGLQLLALYRSGYRFWPRIDFRFADPRLREILLTMVPATVGLMATQVNIYISSSFASTEDGAVTWLNVAFRFLQLPIGMFGVTVGTVALSRFSHSAAEADLEAGLSAVRDTLRSGLRMVALLTLPTTVGMVLLSEPIIGAIYQHGAFGQGDTRASAVALSYYGIGLCAYAAVKVVAPVFYALRRPRLPVIATFLAVFCNILLALLLHPLYGFRVLALGTSVAALVNLAVLLSAFQVRFGGLWRQDLVLPLLKMAVAACVMGLLLSVEDGLLQMFLSRVVGAKASGTFAQGMRLLFGIPLAALVYGGLCHLLHVEEMASLWNRVQRRLFRKT